ncbi:hypothetical protein BB560_001619 [Smittium megazygosporum]|uniref:tRNA N(3)-methylcytidine methyltransferase n=1 Tax=Smittium megazygosporum TaxID=133381 RepID=A0A2T9ZH30_9FUNG|nr:hypothetical protein BB560_001619 [Smittium megazygosporum]
MDNADNNYQSSAPQKKLYSSAKEHNDTPNSESSADQPGFGGRILSDQDNVFDFNAWDNVEPDEEYLDYAKERISFHEQNPVPSENAAQYNSDPFKFWDSFYHKNQNKFFKDRNWFFIEFPELFTWTKMHHNTSIEKTESDSEKNEEPSKKRSFEKETDTNTDDNADIKNADTETPDREHLDSSPESSYNPNSNTNEDPSTEGKHVILELGCGVGNSVFPLLNTIYDPRLQVYACDYSKVAIDVLKECDWYKNDKRCEAFVWDISKDSLPSNLASSSVDTITCIFVLSALHPKEIKTAISNMYKLLKPGGSILFRDYGRHDLAQLRFKANRLLEPNFYIRGDGTRVFFFSNSDIVDLFSPQFTILKNSVDKRLLVNRSRKIVMHRVWIQAKLVKK